MRVTFSWKRERVIKDYLSVFQVPLHWFIESPFIYFPQGDTLETGHYTAACRNPYDQQWYKFDDQNVAKVNSEAIEEEIINNEAYILFYQRRKIDVGECSGGSSSSGDHWVSRITATTAPSATVVDDTTKIGEKSVSLNHYYGSVKPQSFCKKKNIK